MIKTILAEGRVAVITGAASGIGLAAACRFAEAGMKVVLADLEDPRLEHAAEKVASRAPSGTSAVLAVPTDVSDVTSLQALREDVEARFGAVHLLMNNAGIGPGSSIFGPIQAWERVLATNLGGVINGTRVFGEAMIAHGDPAVIINTGSKQGITTPPGDPAYNVAKAGVKVFTEALQHELRNREGCAVSAHLLIPGFVFTGMTAGSRTDKPDAAWTPEQTVDFMIESLDRGDFYILCPDNDVPRALDEKRILWAAADIVENRPPLSRWHPDYGAAFADYLKRDRPVLG
ncbi:short-chain dehydrogenase [Xaviernesmea oryzae]|uniref:Short-chain dehydrogenase n=1 Tax=Xaviernesmea oryzae TaxID=464029 RepID=A0A1Q9B311_9HYPH|nr:SDR family NAD(P)-dependent oxidoreductase [Xaviernesmea oryzae]OLP62404.1 short-chain dehydrogenase [Xaviernesmea oryzae]SEL98421.1 NAD(P)-dependent dehydrogenase, short-chain alcohol dehydrogenase family [Xaviernesmea oryzae]